MLLIANKDNGSSSNSNHPSSNKVDDVEGDVDAGVTHGLLGVNHEAEPVIEKVNVHQDDSFLEDGPVGDDPVVVCPPMESEFKGMAYLHSLQRSS